MKKQGSPIIFLGLWVLSWATVLPGALPSQEKSFDPWLSLERIFQNREFMPESFGPVEWLPNGKTYTTVEKSNEVEGGTDIIAYDAETGKRKVLVSGLALVDPDKKTPLKIEGYSWSKDGRLLLIFTNSQRVWRLNTRGDYWVFDLVEKILEKIYADKYFLF